MPLYPHSILKKPKDVKVDGDVRREPDVVKTTEIDVENDVFDRPAAQPGNKIFRGLPFREQSRSFNVAFGAFLCFLLQSKQCNRGKTFRMSQYFSGLIYKPSINYNTYHRYIGKFPVSMS